MIPPPDHDIWRVVAPFLLLRDYHCLASTDRLFRASLLPTLIKRLEIIFDHQPDLPASCRSPAYFLANVSLEHVARTGCLNVRLPSKVDDPERGFVFSVDPPFEGRLPDEVCSYLLSGAGLPWGCVKRSKVVGLRVGDISEDGLAAEWRESEEEGGGGVEEGDVGEARIKNHVDVGVELALEVQEGALARARAAGSSRGAGGTVEEPGGDFGVCPIRSLSVRNVQSDFSPWLLLDMPLLEEVFVESCMLDPAEQIVMSDALRERLSEHVDVEPASGTGAAAPSSGGVSGAASSRPPEAPPLEAAAAPINDDSVVDHVRRRSPHTTSTTSFPATTDPLTLFLRLLSTRPRGANSQQTVKKLHFGQSRAFQIHEVPVALLPSALTHFGPLQVHCEKYANGYRVGSPYSRLPRYPVFPASISFLHIVLGDGHYLEPKWGGLSDEERYCEKDVVDTVLRIFPGVREVEVELDLARGALEEVGWGSRVGDHVGGRRVLRSSGAGGPSQDELNDETLCCGYRVADASKSGEGSVAFLRGIFAELARRLEGVYSLADGRGCFARGGNIGAVEANSRRQNWSLGGVGASASCTARRGNQESIMDSTGRC